MNEKRNYYYRILGLRPGASLVDIKAAYRSLVKLYHPDRDQSIDTELMYREIRAAYKELLNWNQFVRIDKKTSNGTKISTVDSCGSRDTTWNSGNLDTEYSNSSNTKTSLELKHFSYIFFSSIKGMTITYFVGGIVALVFACAPAVEEPYAGLVVLFHLIFWIFFVFLRYYSDPLEWSILMRSVVAILYGLLLFCLITFFHTEPVNNIIWTCIFAALYILLSL